MKRTKIVCTLGPASHDLTTLFQLGKAGMDVARLNFSHGKFEDHARLMKRLQVVGKRLGRPFGILQDLQGPKIRVGDLPAEGVKLVEGKTTVFATGADLLPGDIPVTLQSLHQDIMAGEKILLDDGLLEGQVERVQGRRIFIRIIKGGVLLSHKGFNLPNTKLRLPALSDKDKKDAAFGVKLGVDYVALSFARRAQDVKDLRRLLDRHGPNGKRIKIIVKVEKQEAVDCFDELLPLVGGIMVARGDLGVETPAEKVPVIQKQLISACREHGVPVIVATQMLDSMIRNPRPTRAEVSDIANAVIDHADAVMLSGETASGAYPVEAVRMMAETIAATEQSRFDDLTPIDLTVTRDVPEVIGATVRVIVEALGRPAVVVATASGRSAQEVSIFRPEAPIYALTYDPHIQRSLRLIWGVEPFLLSKKKTPEQMVKEGIEMLVRSRRLKSRDRVIIVTGSPSGEPGSANKIEIRKI